MIGIDTNVLLRYLTDDDARQSAVAARFITSLRPDARGHIALITVAELVWVLKSRYGASPAELSGTLLQLLSDDRLVVQDPQSLWLALDEVERSKVDLADALIAFVNLQQGCSHTITFDRKALRIPGMALLQ